MNKKRINLKEPMDIIHVFGMSNIAKPYKLVAIQYLTKRSTPDLVLVNDKGESCPYGANYFYINTPENVERLTKVSQICKEITKLREEASKLRMESNPIFTKEFLMELLESQ